VFYRRLQYVDSQPHSFSEDVMSIRNTRAYKSLAALLVLFILLFFPGITLAQSYSFSLPEQFVDVYWNDDGTSSIDYLFVFVNDVTAPPIEYVDVGVPTRDYDLNSVVAYINGIELRDIERSPYVDPGVAVGLGEYSIPPGQSGEVRVFIGRVRNVLFPDDQDPEYVSAVFGTSYFEPGTVRGPTDMVVRFHFPPTVQPDEPRWHASGSGWPSEPEAGIDNDGRVTYEWRNQNARGDTQYFFGASFPAKYVPPGAIVKDQPSGAGAGSTGGSNPLACLSPGLIPFLCFGGFIALIAWGAVAGQRRKLQYLPPKIAIEGHGIKRGLTAVEAAILLEQPMDKILTMILFGVIKKNAAQVIKRDPLELEISKPLPEGLHLYEQNFLEAFKETGSADRRKALQKTMVALVRSVGEKMKGFSRKETVEYYRGITDRAWQQVEAAATPEVKSKAFDDNMEWTMLDKDYDDRTREVFHHGPVFVPVWWSRYDPTFGRTASGPAATPVATTPTTGRSGPAMPHLPGAEFAASIATGVQNFSSKVVGNITDFTSTITNITNPPPKPPASSSGRSYSGRSGGSSCACACACAGCACACAGGGR
jgi:hypothetical protein